MSTATTTTLALKEWGAAVHALLAGRQTLLLRKGGIHEKAFVAPEDGGGFVLFPTVAHSHRDRTRPEHHDLLALGEADATDDAVVVRCGIGVVATVEVARPAALPELSDLHIWTDDSIRRDRLEFRPKHALTALVVRGVALPEPVVVPRSPDHGGCRSWLALPEVWDGQQGVAVHDDDRLRADAERVRRTVG